MSQIIASINSPEYVYGAPLMQPLQGIWSMT